MQFAAKKKKKLILRDSLTLTYSQECAHFQFFSLLYFNKASSLHIVSKKIVIFFIQYL